MSDFLFSSKQQKKGMLTTLLKSIHLYDPPNCHEYHGTWGSLGVLFNHYYGYNPFENERFILVVIGGPILKFPGAPSFYKTMPQNVKTEALLKKWKSKNTIKWDSDLSGPFSILCIDKQKNKIEIITDMMSFIPVFFGIQKIDDKAAILGTHVDLVAELTGCNTKLDKVSISDFIINSTITFPYTFYKNIRQMSPGTINCIEKGEIDRKKGHTYWSPVEHKNKFTNIKEAALALRTITQESIQKICENQENIGVLLSGGEDSRVVLASIPEGLNTSAYTFLDSYNREGVVAEKIAKIYKAQFNLGFRSSNQYLEQLEECSNLVGSQNEFTHIHAYKFHKRFNFMKHGAILGGFYSDSYLKGYYIPDFNISVNLKRIGIFSSRIRQYQIRLGQDFDENYLDKIFSNMKIMSVFSKKLICSVIQRQKEHFKRVKAFCPTTALEWMKLWPLNESSPYYSGNRRLFRSYEPFLDSECIKFALSVPQQWKINRQLFQEAFKPLISSSWYVTHAGSGHFPYFSPLCNIPLRKMVKFYRKFFKLRKYMFEENQGPWPNYGRLVNTDYMRDLINCREQFYDTIKPIFNNLSYFDLFNNSALSPRAKLRVLQALFMINRKTTN